MERRGKHGLVRAPSEFVAAIEAGVDVESTDP
jgi:hypothetical protein